ncbi:MAG: nuclear transport factor 2 family protein [Alphaproteobacteria bacterium]|nr:MAG: nuclear transport factor 2 family protein [Alphaproteobacteria bacterium]
MPPDVPIEKAGRHGNRVQTRVQQTVASATKHPKSCCIPVADATARGPNMSQRDGKVVMSAHRPVLDAIINAWKAGDTDTVLGLLHDDVIYHFHVGTAPLVGKAAVETFLAKFGAGQTDIKWTIVRTLEADGALMIEGIDDYVDADGIHVRMPYMGVMEFEDGKVKYWRDYFDRGVLVAAKEKRTNAAWDAVMADLTR